jgi:hypothetical protein
VARRQAARRARRQGLCVCAPRLTPRARQVLHMDRNNYYGGESASYNLTQARAQARKRSHTHAHTHALALRAHAPGAPLPYALPNTALGEVPPGRGGAR